MSASGALLSQFIIKETSDLDDASLTGSGALEVAPGETKTLVEYEPQRDRAFLLALGATDHDNTEYELHFGQQRMSQTNGPVGLVNQPLSFRQKLGIVPPFERTFKYKVSLSESASESKLYAARAYVTETPPTAGNGGGN